MVSLARSSGLDLGGHLRHVADVIGLREGVKTLAAMNLLQLPRHTIFVCDTYINVDPSAEELAEPRDGLLRRGQHVGPGGVHEVAQRVGGHGTTMYAATRGAANDTRVSWVS